MLERQICKIDKAMVHFPDSMFFVLEHWKITRDFLDDFYGTTPEERGR
jgi:hypothetical protein